VHFKSGRGGGVHRATRLYAVTFTRIFPCYVNIRIEIKHSSSFVYVQYIFIGTVPADIQYGNTRVQSRQYSNA